MDTATTDIDIFRGAYCDRCPGRAQVSVQLPSGGALLFCGHHEREHGPKLTELGALFIHQEASEEKATTRTVPVTTE